MHAILNKKVITKSLLLDYVNEKKLPGASTKADLIERIVQHWKETYSDTKEVDNGSAKSPSNVVYNIVNINATIVQKESRPPPLQIMSEQFTSWLFERINNQSLTEVDLSRDVTSAIRLIDAMGNTQDMQAEGATSVLPSLLHLYQEFKFQLAPNVSPMGVRGKMNSYGMVMIASCGTVYRDGVFVGIFEAGFGLLPDPQSPDCWKLKHSKLQIKSVAGEAQCPQLEACETLHEILALPETEGHGNVVEYHGS